LRLTTSEETELKRIYDTLLLDDEGLELFGFYTFVEHFNVMLWIH